MSDARQWVLGVDGGGTKTVAWVAEAESQPSCATASRDAVSSVESHCLRASSGTQVGASGGTPVVPLGQAVAGPSNPQSVGWDTALASLDTAIDEAFAAAEQATHAHAARAPFAAAVLALAGSDRPENRRRLLEWAERRRLATRLALVHDGQAVLAAGSPDFTGIALIAGTGSLAFGRDRSGRTARAGGWGFLASDEGSGYWIAVEGLRAAARSHDGYGDPAPALAQAFADALGAENFEAMIPRLYELADDRAAIASLARVVWNVAGEKAAGAVARRILMEAAGHLAKLVRCVAEKLDWDGTEFPLAIGGGVVTGSGIAHNQSFDSLLAIAWQSLHQRVEKTGLPMAARDPLAARGTRKGAMLPTPYVIVVESPTAGAVQLAQRLLAQPPGVHSL
jgi:N-acetylglucosamine kinase-like BadF-type ATPase